MARFGTYSDFYIGVDIGVTTHPSAMTVLRRVVPDADAQPLLEVHDMALGRGVPFPEVAREVKRVLGALDGTATVGVDATGPGEGAAQELRRQGVRCTAMRITGGAGKISARGDRWSVPQKEVFEVTYRLIVQRRLKINPAHPLTATLVEEMDACTAEFTDAGNVRYSAATPGGHGDLLFSLGIAALLHERPYAVEVHVTERRARNPEGRPTGGTTRPWCGSAGRRRIEQLRAERERRWRDAADALWRPVGWTGDEVG